MARKINSTRKCKKSTLLSPSTAYALRAIYGDTYYLMNSQALTEAIRRIEGKDKP